MFMPHYRCERVQAAAAIEMRRCKLRLLVAGLSLVGRSGGTVRVDRWGRTCPVSLKEVRHRVRKRRE
jgi:hypothetical protein